MIKRPKNFSDIITKWIGSRESLFLHTVFFIGIFTLKFLDYSSEDVLLILTTIVSLEAIYLSIFIQMTINKHSEELEEVSVDVDEIQKDIDEIQKDVDEIQEDVEGISEDVDEIQKDVDEIQEDVDEISEDVEEISEDENRVKKIEKIEKVLEDLLSEISKLKK